MRAQNEPPETVVRLVRGEIDGEPTDVPGRLPRRAGRRGGAREGRIWPQSRGSQLAGLGVGARKGERVLDLCAAPGGKATMLAGEVVAVESRGPGPGAGGERAPARRHERHRRRTPTRSRSPAELTGFDRALVDAPCSGSASSRAARPALALAAAAGAPARAVARRRRARAARRDDRLLGLHAERRRERGRRRRVGLEVDDLGEEWPQFGHPRAPSSCSRCRTSTARPASSSRA